jgi:hypothetical protein
MEKCGGGHYPGKCPSWNSGSAPRIDPASLDRAALRPYIMRISEWINLGYFSFFTILALLRPPGRPRRSAAIGICSVGIGAIIAITQFGKYVFTPFTLSVVRDWLPALLLLMPYWVAGLFFSGANQKLQSRLLRFDYVLLSHFRALWPGGRVRRWLLAYLEIAYAICYLIVPLAIGILYLGHMGIYADRFWSTVLLPTYISFMALPFFPTLPPRVLDSQPAQRNSKSKIRHLNLWILQHASIQVNTFPSGHVAASVSAALALLPLMPAVGLLFVLIAISIGLGAVIGRYHYAADALLAAAIAVATFILEWWFWWG